MPDYCDFFPYPEFKPLQLRVMDFVSDVIDREAVGLVEAYCGFGKTIAAIAPALSKGKKILLLTPTYSARNSAAAEALKINKVNGKKIKIADLRAKSLMCKKFPKDSFSLDACLNSIKYKKDCEFFSNTCIDSNKTLSFEAGEIIDKIQKDVTEKPQVFFGNGLIEKEPHFFQSVQKICDSHKFCSYEIMKKIAEEADVIILDYFWCFTHIFTVLQKMIETEEFVLLIDEADLLIDRLYENFNQQLGLQGLHKLLKQAEFLVSRQEMQKTDLDFLKEFIQYTEEFLLQTSSEKALKPVEIIDFFVKRFKETAIEQGLQGSINFEIIIENLSTIIEIILGSEEFEKASARPDTFLQHLFSIQTSSQYLTFIPKTKNKISVKPFEISNIVLANKKTILQTLQEFNSAILFSATIGDEELFKTELGLEKETMVFKVQNMPHKKLLVLIDTELNTLFKNREKTFPEYIKKIKALKQIDPSLLVSCCNSFEANKILEEIPSLENAEFVENLDAEKSFVLNIRTKHARSTNKAKNTRNCLVIGLPLPDYSDFYFQQRKKFLEDKYSRLEAGKLLNRKAIFTAVQLMGRITRNLSSPKTITLADSRYKKDFFLGEFYYNTIPEYIKPYLKTVKNTEELKKEIGAFWEK